MATIAVEAGGYTRWIYDAITKLCIDFYVVNPHKIKLFAESQRKTDKIDAKILADLLRMDGLPRKVHVAEGESRELRDLLRSQYNRYTLKNRLMDNFDHFLTSIRHIREESSNEKPMDMVFIDTMA